MLRLCQAQEINLYAMINYEFKHTLLNLLTFQLESY